MRVAIALTQSRVTLAQFHRFAALMLLSVVAISAAVAQTPWSQQYVSLNHYGVSAPLPSGDGGVWMAYARLGTGFTLEKRDATGALVLRTSRGFTWGVDFGQLQIATGAGGFIYVAFNGSTCAVVMRFDGQGNFDWERSLTNRCYGGNKILTLTGTADGGVVVGTGRQGFPTSLTSLAKLDQQGNAVWTRNVDPPAGGERFQLHQLIEDSSGALFFVGESGPVYDPNLDRSQAFVGSLSATGNLQWIQSLGIDAQKAFGLCEWDATTLVVVGGSKGGPLGRFRGYLASVSKTGVPSAGIVYEDFSNLGVNRVFRSISTLPSGARWIVGYQYPNTAANSGNGDILVGTVDSNLNFTSLVRFGGPRDDAPNAQIAAWSTGFALSGISTSFTPGGRAAAFLQTYIDAGTNCLGPTAIVPNSSPLTISAIPNGTTFTAVTASTGPFSSGVVSSIDPGEEVLCGTRCLEDSFEDDDTCNVVQSPLAGQTPVRHQFCDDSDDWVTVNACFSQQLDFVTSDLQPSADTRLEVYGPGCTAAPLISNDNGGGGFAAAIRDWPVPTSGAYHVLLHSNTGSGAGHGTSLVINGNTTNCQAYGSTYGGTALDTAFDVDLDANGGVMIAGRSDSATSGGTNLAVLRVSADGPIAETIALNSTSSGLEEARGVRRTPDGGMIIVGNSRGVGGRQDQVIWKRDVAGSVAWQRRIHSDSADYATVAIVVAPGGTTYVMYSDTPTISGTKTARVVGLNSAGSVVGRAVFSASSAVEGRALHALTGGDVAVLVQTGGTQLEVLRMSASLANLVWQTAVSTPDRGTLVHRAIREDSSQNLIVAGAFSREGSGATDVDLIRLSADGQLIDEWVYTLDSTAEINGVSLRADDGIYISGTYNFGSDKDILAIKLSAAGDVIWGRRYGSTSEDVGTAVVTTFDGSPAIVGSGDVDPSPTVQRDFWLLRPDNDGNLGNACTRQNVVNVLRSGAHFSAATPLVIADQSTISPTNGNLATVSLTMSALTSCSGPARTMPKETSGSGQGGQDAVTPLLIAADHQTLTWEPAASNNADRFTLVRGDVAQLSSGNYGDCFADAIAPNTYVDAASPDAGQAWFYLVRGENSAGNGVLGKDSAGRTRVYWGRCIH